MKSIVTRYASSWTLLLSLIACSTGPHSMLPAGFAGASGSIGFAPNNQTMQAGRGATTASAGVGAAGIAAPSAGTAGRPNAGTGAAGSIAIDDKDDDAGVAPPPDAGAQPPAAGAGGTAAPPTALCPSTPPLAAGDTMGMLQHAGTTRQYLVHVPKSYDGSKPVPLVLDFHGWMSSAMAESGASGWREKSDAVGFIAVYPIGLDASWNGGALCCGTSQSGGVDDEGFALAVVKKLEADACIDPKRVYVTGISNGGAMSHLLACKHADVFAAAAPVSMGNGTTPCNPSRPISVIMVRGQQDELVAYNGGIFPSARADFDMWRNIDGCTGTPQTTHTVCQSYTGCKAGTEVTLCSLPQGMHNVYQDDAELQLADVVWEGFARQALP